MSTNTHLPQFPMNGTELECGGEELRLDGTCARCERVNERIESKITTARKEARAEARRECAEFFSHWLLRAYEGIHRDTSYEEGESLDSLARELNQVIGFAGYEPESTARQLLLNKKFAWNELHLDEAAATTQKGENDAAV